MSKLNYTYGTIDDMEEVIALCGKWWKDSSFYKNTEMEFLPDKGLFQGLDDQDSLFVIKGVNTLGEIKACYVASISPYHFNPGYTMATEIVWCLDEDYRKGREVFQLVTNIELGLKSSGIDIYYLNLPVEEGKEVLGDYLVKKKGFFKQDLCLMKEIRR